MSIETITLAGEGVALRADVAGPANGAPVVLLHGGGQTRHAWRKTQLVLAERGWRTYSVDQRGHGESEWPADASYRIDDFAADIRAIAHELATPAVLIGASLGGIASLIAVGESSQLVARALVLVDIAPRIEVEGSRRVRDFMAAHVHDGFGSLEEVADAIAAYNPHRPRPSDLAGLRKNVRQRADGRWVWHWDPRFMVDEVAPVDEARVHASGEQRLERAARALTLPVLLVRGKLSDLLSPEGAQDLLRLVPHAELADVSGAGHMIAGDRNDAFNDAIVEFLDRRAPA